MSSRIRHSNPSDIRIIRLRIDVTIMFNDYRNKKSVRNN